MMIKKIKSLKFAVTTSDNKRYRCKNCSKKLEGRKGFVSLIISGSENLGWGRYNDVDKYIYICRECFDKMIIDYQKDKKKASKMYDERVKKRMLIELNKGNP